MPMRTKLWILASTFRCPFEVVIGIVMVLHEDLKQNLAPADWVVIATPVIDAIELVSDVVESA